MPPLTMTMTPLPPSLSKPSILLVDDREEDLLTLAEVLDRSDYELILARSGQQALRHLLSQDFAVILLDVHMPMMDGFEVASIIKQRDRSRYTPIIFLTADDADVGPIYRAYSVGAVDYLTKPIDRDVVRAKVAIFVDLHMKGERIKQQAEALLAADRRERERKLVELQQLSERRYKNLAEAIPQIVWTANARGEVEYFNGRWATYTGVPLRDAVGRAWLEMVHPEDRTRFLEAWTSALEDGHTLEVELRLREEGGAYRWHLCRAVAERGKDDEIIGWLGTYTDFHDLKTAHDEAREAIRSRDDFLAVATHELRTPLATLNLQADGLLKGLDPKRDERTYPRAEAVRRQVDRLERLIESLLDVSRIASGRLQLAVERCDLSALVRDVCERSRFELERAGSELTLDIPSLVIGWWDRMRLEQVVLNLLGNAIKYGLGKPIAVSLTADHERARLTIRDHGIGISAADRSKVFMRFVRATSIDNYGGVGLGLWIARQIVEAMDGTIEVESVPDEGSTFTVSLPMPAQS